MNVGVHQRRLVAPVDLAAFRLGLCRDGRIFLIEPFLDRFRALLIGAPDRFLRRETPALQILADAAHRQLDLKFGLDQLADRRTRPKCEAHFQLLRPLLDDQLLNVRLLIGREDTALAILLAPRLRLEPGHAARLVEVDRRANGRPAQTGQLNDLHHAILLLMQTDHLLAPLMQLRKALCACVILPHAKAMRCFARVFKASACRVYRTSNAATEYGGTVVAKR